MSARAKVIEDLIARRGRTFCEEVGVRIEAGTPSVLFRWLTACVLFSAPIQHERAAEAARALSRAGWRTAAQLAASTFEERVRVLNGNGYARYDERTARMLQNVADLVVERYRGDLRRLREAAAREPGTERRLLKEIKGIGDVGVDIFFREVQGIWDELYPFADDLALKGAGRLGLGRDAAAVARHVPRADFVRLVAALARDELER